MELSNEMERIVQNKLDRKLKQCIAVIIESNIPTLKRICIFGSFARGDFDIYSDVDLAVITSEPMQDRRQKAELAAILEEPNEEGVGADIIFLVDGAATASITFNREFTRDAITVWKEDEKA